MSASIRSIGVVVAVAAVLASCGGSLTTPGGADAGADVRPGLGGWPRRQDATVSVPVPDARGMDLCPDRPAEPIDGTTCLYFIPEADVCTGIGIRVHVLIDGIEVAQLADDGWTFIDASQTSIELHGAACERALQSPTGPTIHFTFYLP